MSALQALHCARCRRAAAQTHMDTVELERVGWIWSLRLNHKGEIAAYDLLCPKCKPKDTPPKSAA